MEARTRIVTIPIMAMTAETDIIGVIAEIETETGIIIVDAHHRNRATTVTASKLLQSNFFHLDNEF